SAPDRGAPDCPARRARPTGPGVAVPPGTAGSGDATGVLLARRLTGRVREGQRLGEGQLERAQPVAEGAGVLVADIRCRRGHQTRQRVDQLPRLGEILVLPG